MSKDNSDFFNKKNPWSIVKDELLACYLKPYFAKILNTSRPTVYVDCFAGKGRFDDDNLGSPLIALQIMQEHKEYHHNTIKPIFIELKHAKELQKNLLLYDKKAHVLEGRYEQYIDDILHKARGSNVFLYIDPYGIKSLSFHIFEASKRTLFNSFEVLMNLNTFGFLREACRISGVRRFDIDTSEVISIDDTDHTSSVSEPVEALNIVAGGDYWQDIIRQYHNGNIDGYIAENLFAKIYCEKLRSIFKYTLDMQIALKEGQQPKYRMIFATNHPGGCIIMNDNMCKRWELWREKRALGQSSLFTKDSDNNIYNDDDIRELVKKELQRYPGIVELNEFYAGLFMNSGVKFHSTCAREQLKKLEESGEINVLRRPAFTKTGKPSLFWESKSNQRVEIRNLK